MTIYYSHQRTIIKRIALLPIIVQKQKDKTKYYGALTEVPGKPL